MQCYLKGDYAPSLVLSSFRLNLDKRKQHRPKPITNAAELGTIIIIVIIATTISMIAIIQRDLHIPMKPVADQRGYLKGSSAS